MKSQHGGITIKLWAPPNASDGRTGLVVEPDDGGTLTITDAAGLLAQILDEMPSLGYDPQKLEMISTWLQNTEYREGVERSLAETGKWESCAGRKYCHQLEFVANHYLESVGAFKSFDSVLSSHRLIRRSVRVDDMGVGKKSGQVSCSGLIVIALARKE